MKNSYLFPHRFKKIGIVVFLLSFSLLIAVLSLNWSPELFDFKVLSLFKDHFIKGQTSGFWEENNVLDEILAVVAIISGLLWCFSKEKLEDELIATIRKEALIWAFYVNYGLFIIATLLIYGFSFFHVLMLNVFTPIIVFIIRFEWKKFQLKKASDEE